MKKILPIFLLAILVSTLAVQAQPLPKIKTFVDVEYVSGGISLEEEQALAEMTKDFTLKVVTALSCGDYLNKINLLILDAADGIVLETVTNGPILYANLADGKYTVVASAFGEQYKKPITAKTGRQKQLVFYWPVEPTDCGKSNNNNKKK